MSVHGKRSTYNNHDCRCIPCTEAQRAYQVELRARLNARRKAAERFTKRPAAHLVHGSAPTYINHGCRCGPCTEANTLKTAEQRAKRRQKGKK